MRRRKMTETLLDAFSADMKENEKSRATQEKYMRDLRRFYSFCKDMVISKSIVLAYKSMLEREYALTSANSMIAALNSFLRFAGREDCCVKQFKIQKKTYCSEEKELTRSEYEEIVRCAKKKNERLALLIQTICGTGIRVSELEFITVEAVKRGEATVSCKGKTRTVFIVYALREKLLGYAKKNGVSSGSVFVSKNGNPLNRSNIWHEMKALCKYVNVPASKVFPHNLRHLFARTFYKIEKDIAKLADVLGHSNINTTRIYMISTGAEHRRKIEAMHLII